MGKTIIDKIWDAHTVRTEEGGRSVLYIDRQYIHEVTSPVAFAGLERRELKVARPAQVTATADHNIPTVDQHLPIEEEQGRRQVEALTENCARYGIELFGVGHPRQGIVHIIGPEQGFTQPGMTIICGDSHTSTHGAMGAIAFGVGTSEVEMALASQCIIQSKPRTMRITVDGALGERVEAKDLILYLISRISTSGGTGYFIEFAGEAVRALSMEGRMTVCNMAIECGARGGIVAPDDTTFDYLEGRPEAPKGAEWDAAVKHWRTLASDPDAVFDKEYTINASRIIPMITWGTNPGEGIPITGRIPASADRKALAYMGFRSGEKLIGKPIDYVFVGSCTNGRIEDLRLFTHLVAGRRKADNITAWIVPGSKEVERLAREEGLERTLNEAGFELRQPGCSACLAMNADKIPAGKYCVSTSNRNFEGRQGPGSRTLLSGVAVAAAAAVTGRIEDPRKIFGRNADGDPTAM
jgi:3-isopropylmalate/(R)-2-methylmalate dehydratase large subunit